MEGAQLTAFQNPQPSPDLVPKALGGAKASVTLLDIASSEASRLVRRAPHLHACV